MKQEKEALDSEQTQEGKIRRLLDLASEKGLFFAIDVAKKMNDHYTLDVLHDILIKEGLYKKFRK